MRAQHCPPSGPPSGPAAAQSRSRLAASPFAVVRRHSIRAPARIPSPHAASTCAGVETAEGAHFSNIPYVVWWSPVCRVVGCGVGCAGLYE